MTHNPARRDALRTMAAAVAASSWPAHAQTHNEAGTYNVSVVPQFPAAEIHRDWVPLLERLSKLTDVTLKLHLFPSIPRFEAEVMLGQPDFAFMNPYHAVMAMRAQGYVPLVRDSKLLTGILVVRKDDPIQSVKELTGKELAFPSPNAFGASLLMRSLLAEQERIAITPVYVQTHSNVYRQVIRGKSAAGGAVNQTLLQESDEVRSELRVLFETPGSPPHPLAAHPRVPVRVQRAVSEALLRLAGEPAGNALLRAVAMSAPMRSDYGRDYKPLERLKLENYVVNDRPA